jgi:hypothetical protein
VGAAGELLNSILKAIHIPRESVFIANIVKCRPPQNRKPLPDEVAACLPYLQRQVALIRPKVIMALGGTAAESLLPGNLPLRISFDIVPVPLLEALGLGIGQGDSPTSALITTGRSPDLPNRIVVPGDISIHRRMGGASPRIIHRIVHEPGTILDSSLLLLATTIGIMPLEIRPENILKSIAREDDLKLARVRRSNFPLPLPKSGALPHGHL